MRPTLLAAILLVPLGPRAAAAQDVYDRAVFVITRGGAETGRIEFAIREAAGRNGRRGLLVAATTRTPAHEVQYAQELTDLIPTSFQQTETVGNRVMRRVSATVIGVRFSARASTPDGDVSRELPVRGAFVILGDEDYTAYYFMPRPDSGQSIPFTVIRTRDVSAVPASIAGLGGDMVTVAGRAIRCQHFALTVTGEETREFWITEGGSLVQVGLPTSGLTARRAEAPGR